MSDEKELYSVTLNPEDVKSAAENVVIEADSSTKETVRDAIGTGNIVVDNYMRKTEGVSVREALNQGTVRVADDLGGALGTYELAGRNAGRTSLLRRYAYNPLRHLATAIYTHEAIHKALDKVFGYQRALMQLAEKAWEINPVLGLLTAEYGHALNEGLTDGIRLKSVGEKGLVSAYQRNGFVGAAMYALRRRGGIRNLIRELPEAIGDFVYALRTPQLAFRTA